MNSALSLDDGCPEVEKLAFDRDRNFAAGHHFSLYPTMSSHSSADYLHSGVLLANVTIGRVATAKAALIALT